MFSDELPIDNLSVTFYSLLIICYFLLSIDNYLLSIDNLSITFYYYIDNLSDSFSPPSTLFHYEATLLSVACATAGSHTHLSGLCCLLRQWCLSRSCWRGSYGCLWSVQSPEAMLMSVGHATTRGHTKLLSESVHYVVQALLWWRAMSESTVLLHPGSAQMSMAHVITEGPLNAHSLCCRLKSHWRQWSMSPPGPLLGLWSYCSRCVLGLCCC